MSALASVTGGLCTGQSALFCSTDAVDHEQAKAICAVCPALTACAQALDEARKANRYAAPEGTWAGQFLNNSDRRHRGAWKAWRAAS